MKTQHDSKPTTKSIPERRKNPRYWLCVPLTIRSGGGSDIRGLSVEISEGGMSAMASEPLKVGERVELEPVEGGRVSALVRHKLGQMYGFEFVDLSAEHAQRIAESCRKFAIDRVARAKN
jgi:c-di-GMP-binding flagellar brake protein YcgR